MYLTNNTPLDIAHAVHACARYTSNPKKIHAAAVKPIRRCLKGTKDKGMILDPSNKYEIDCYM